MQNNPEHIKLVKLKRSIAEIKPIILHMLTQHGGMSTPTLAEAMSCVRVTDTFRKAYMNFSPPWEIAYTEPKNPKSRKQKLKLSNR